MAYYNDGKVFRNLPEQVEKNKSDIESIQDAQKTDESNINTNLNNINAHETRINALESLKMTQDGQNIKLTKSTGEIGNIAVGTVGGTNLLGGNDVTFKTINGEAITGEGNLSVDSGLATLLWANLGIGRWRNQTFFTDYDTNNTIYDSMMANYANYSYMFACTGFIDSRSGEYNTKDVMMSNAFAGSSSIPEAWNRKNFSYVFYNWKNASKLTINLQDDTNVYFGNTAYTFAKSNITALVVEGGELHGTYFYHTFYKCHNLVSVDGFNMINMESNTDLFKDCNKLKHIGFTHWRKSFDISSSTQFEEADLVEILNNLDSVSTTQTLVMGATNLAKLTTDDILIATGKGWQLA